MDHRPSVGPRAGVPWLPKTEVRELKENQWQKPACRNVTVFEAVLIMFSFREPAFLTPMPLCHRKKERAFSDVPFPWV